MASKTTTSWLKEALLLLARIPKLLAPYLLYAVIILMPVVNRVYVNPLTAELSRHLGQMEDPSSAEYARLLEETQRDARSLLLISIADALVTLTLAFVARCFATSGTSSSGSGSGDRYSLAELLRELTKWRNLKASLVAFAVTQLASVALLGGNFATVIRDSTGLLSVQGFPFLAAASSLAFLYMGVVALMSVATKRKDLAMMVLATVLLSTLLIPVCELAVLHLYTEQVVMGLGLSLLAVYDILQAVQSLLYFLAANVYHDYYKARAMEESKETMVASDAGKEDRVTCNNRNVIEIPLSYLSPI